MRAILAAALARYPWPSTALGPTSQNFDRIERGRYLATLADCSACHTEPGGPPFAGGLALQTPFGTIVAPNITPDPETGIGAMDRREFRGGAA